MNVFDRLKILFNGNQQKRLPGKKEVYEFKKKEDTSEYVQIGTAIIRKIISNENNYYQKFKKFEDNAELFGEDKTKDNYIDAIIIYANYMSERGYNFSKTEIKNIREITGQKITIPKYEIGTQEHKNQLYFNLCMELLRNREKLNQYINTNDEYQDSLVDPQLFIERFGVEKIDFAGYFDYYILQELEKNEKPTRNGVVLDIEEYEGFNFKVLQKLYYKAHKIDSGRYKVSDEIQKTILDKIPDNIDDISFARAVYIELNKLLKYNASVWYYKQFEFSSYVRAEYTKDIQDVTLQNNKVLCIQAAKIYASILASRGYNVYLPGKDNRIYGHSFVYIVGDDYFISADSTNTEIVDGVLMSDLGRAVLNIKPAEFNVIATTGKEISLDEVDRNLGYKFDEYKFTREQNHEELDRLAELLEDKDIEEELFDLKNETSMQVIVTKKLNFLINDVMKKHPGLDEVTMRAYLSNVMYVVFTGEEYDYLDLVEYYQKHNEKSGKEHELRPGIIVNIGTLKEKKLRYILYCQDKGFMVLTQEELDRDYETELEKYVISRSLFPGKTDDEIMKEVKEYYGDELNNSDKSKEFEMR